MQLIRLISILIINSWRVIVISDNMSHKAVDYLNAKERFTRESERDRMIVSRLSSCRLFELYNLNENSIKICQKLCNSEDMS